MEPFLHEGELERAIQGIIGAAPTLAAAGTGILGEVATRFQCDAALFWLLEPGNDVLRCTQVWSAAGAGLASFAASNLNTALGRDATKHGQVWAREAWCEEKIVAVQDMGQPDEAGASREFDRHGFKACVALPIHGGNGVVGVLEFFARGQGPSRTSARETLGALEGQVSNFMRMLQAEERVRSSRALDAVARLAGGIAHTFNNLLAVIAGNAELMVADLKAGETDSVGLKESAGEILDAAARGADITRQLLAFGRRQSLACADVQLDRVVESEVAAFQRTAGPSVSVRFVCGAVRAIVGDADRIREVIHLMIANANAAMPDGGLITIGLAEARLDAAAADLGVAAGEYLRCTISDTGAAIGGAAQSQIFEPFFTTGGLAMRRGLGLAVAHGIIRQSGGAIQAASSAGTSTHFTIYFPCHASRPPG